MPAAKRYFVDANVLLYLTDTKDQARQARAADWLDCLWRERSGCLSWQVLHEFYVNAVGKLKVPREDARFLVAAYLEWRPVDSSPALLERAWHWMDHARLPYWDALILAAAEFAGCDFLLSEDFQDGRRYHRIRVINPFKTAPPGLAPGIPPN
jgi:predicted nucleic acid-binding protein